MFQGFIELKTSNPDYHMDSELRHQIKMVAIKHRQSAETQNRVHDLLTRLCAMTDIDDMLRVLEKSIHRMVPSYDPTAKKHPHERNDICFNHPDDPSKVILFVNSGSYGRYALYCWGNDTKNQLLPRIFEQYHGYTENGNAFSLLVVEKLHAKEKPNKTRRPFPLNNVNYFQVVVIRACEIACDSSDDFFNNKFSSFATFLSFLREKFNTFHTENPSQYPYVLSIQHINRMLPWLHDCYDLFVTANKIGTRRLHMSEMFSRGNKLVLTNPIGKMRSDYKSKGSTGNTTSYNINPLFGATMQSVLSTPMKPLAMDIVGTTDVTYMYHEPVTVKSKIDIYSYYRHPQSV